MPTEQFISESGSDVRVDADDGGGRIELANLASVGFGIAERDALRHIVEATFVKGLPRVPVEVTDGTVAWEGSPTGANITVNDTQNGTTITVALTVQEMRSVARGLYHPPCS